MVAPSSAHFWRTPGIAITLAVFLGPSTCAVAAQKPDPLDAAIAKALAYLDKAQEPDGGWSANGAKNPAVTGLAVLAFLAAGHVPGEGPYGPTVEKGVRWVLKMQQPNGLCATDGNHEMYHHGICTMMLAEVFGMADARLSKEMKPRLDTAVALLLKAQRTAGPHSGGWRYRVEGFDADMSVTGWQLLALRAAKNLGCDVPAQRIDLAVEYVKRCRHPATGGFCYMTGGAGLTLPCTATGIVCLEICGKDRHHTKEALAAGDYLLKNPQRWNEGNFCYGFYYASQAMFQLGGKYWSEFRPHLHQALLANQETDGSWAVSGFGSSYATAMFVLALAVEYRFLPIYQRHEEPAEGKIADPASKAKSPR